MLKVRLALPHALLAPALLLFAVAMANAQAPADKTQTPNAAPGQSQAARPTPLTAGRKIERSFRSAFLRPTPYLLSAFTAGVTQWREHRPPNKTRGDDFADWGSRAARNFATSSASTLFAEGFYPALFHQDPRYERSQQKSFARRALHAASRVFVTRGDDWRLEPNYSLFAGEMTASALSNVWEHNTPGHDRIGADATLRRFAGMLATDMLTNVVFREFGPDIKKIFRH
ncbi:MAG: hypothetical protein DMF67_03390 [Acidobacteria bacterium]|nr:MAG: hypothetical protein DMF67_03390 [Acidobacteriota bacterium]